MIGAHAQHELDEH